MTVTISQATARLQFFDFLFGGEVGNLCIALAKPDKTGFRQQWFEWPSERAQLGRFIEERVRTYNIWFGVSLFNIPERRRAYAIPGTRIWSDLDEVEPLSIDPIPSVVVESSPGRYQAIWSLDNPIPPEVSQDYSRRIAYKYEADKSGWDLEQLLRVPKTLNFKYEPPAEVKLVNITGTLSTTDFFEELPPVTETGEISEDYFTEVPEWVPDAKDVFITHSLDLNNILNPNSNVLKELYLVEPNENDDWSGRLWRLINLSLELGLSDEETFSLALTAKCNKYARDNRPISHLWREVKKASLKQKQFGIAIKTNRLVMPRLVDEDLVDEDSFVSQYKEWANEATDAPEQYHELSCFIALSAVISQGLSLELSFNSNFRPHLWGLLLGETTYSRKTTSMRMAMDLITELDPTLILASDGSAEGLLTALSFRPKRSSIFYRDEVSGFFDSINRKDYLAGFPETLTQLYDVPKVYSRQLRKESITVVEPYFIFFGGGIRDKVYGLISDEYILSGFIPRFLVVSSENDLSRLRRTGPPTAIGTNKKDALLSRIADIKEQYGIQVPVQVGTQSFDISREVKAYLTPQAWEYFGDLEETIPLAVTDTAWEVLALPTLSRMLFSMLKMSMLVAASRKQISDSNTLEIDLSDLHQAAFYVQKWGQHSLDLIMAAGKSLNEKKLEKVLSYIAMHPAGVTQSQMMQRFHLTSKDNREIRDTLSDRGLIKAERRGNGIVLRRIT